MLGQEVGNSARELVLVRAYGDEPVVLREVERREGVVVVQGDGGQTIGFPESCVFAYSADMFDRLREAYDRKDADLLQSLWREASRA